MYTLLDTCLSKIDSHEYLNRVLGGITDENEIRAICYLMLIRLAHVAPTAVTQRENLFILLFVHLCSDFSTFEFWLGTGLDSAADIFVNTLNEKLPENTVKQEQETHQQMQKSALRAFAVLSRLAHPSRCISFRPVV
jgi:cullin-associated NEDD8-dissociated protein 1